ncbi:MAG: efflux RND transporter periplasmic adaptor subunit [Shimia sp.]
MAEGKRRGRAGAIVGWIVGAALLIGGVALFVIPMLAEDEASAAPEPAPLVEVASAARVDGPVTLGQTAFVRAADRVQVTAEVSGRVALVAEAFRTGQRVTADSVLISLDADRFRNDVARARAQLRQAEARADQAEAELGRRAELARSDIASDAALEQAQTARATAAGDVALAEAQLDTAELALADTVVRAPFDAIVTEQDVSVGQLVQAGSPVGTLARADFAELRVGLTERQFTLLGGAPALRGSEVAFTPRRIGPVMTDMRARTGRVTAVSPVIDEGARTIAVTVRIERPFAPTAEGAAALQLNQLVTVDFPVPTPEDTVLWRAPLGVVQVAETLWTVAGGELAPLGAEITRRTDREVFFTAPDYDGGPLLTTAVDTPVEGLKVRVAE